MDDYDVVVCGGGPAGIGAAFSAANLGLRTAIIERHFMLGGNWTNGYVLSVLGMYTYDGKSKIVGGIADEVVEELKKNGGTAGQAGNFVPFRPDEMKLTLDMLAEKKGITVYYGSLVKGAKKEGNRISSVYVSGKSNIEVKGKFFCRFHRRRRHCILFRCENHVGHGKFRRTPASYAAFQDRQYK